MTKYHDRLHAGGFVAHETPEGGDEGDEGNGGDEEGGEAEPLTAAVPWQVTRAIRRRGYSRSSRRPAATRG